MMSIIPNQISEIVGLLGYLNTAQGIDSKVEHCLEETKDIQNPVDRAVAHGYCMISGTGILKKNPVMKDYCITEEAKDTMITEVERMLKHGKISHRVVNEFVNAMESYPTCRRD